MKKALSMVLVTVLLTGVLAGCGGGSESAKGTDVIKVNDTTLDSNYVDTRIEQIFKQNQLESDDAYSGYYKSQIISGLVETELMVQEAKKRGIEVSDEDKEMFSSELGITESGLDKLVKTSYDTLGLFSYLTAGEKEVRAWTIKKGTKAPQAAGKIHTDFEKGFIKAEIVSYEDLMEAGNFTKAKEKGKVRIEGKDYVIQDNDVVLFRFNV